MSEGDTPQAAGPQTIDEYLASRPAPAEADKPQEVEDTPAPEEVEEVEAQAEAEAEESEAENDDSPDDADEPTPEDDDGPQVLTLDEYGEVAIEVDGQRTTIAELAKGNLRQADYSRKTEALAKERKALDAEKAQLAEKQRQLDAAALQANDDEPEPDWEKLMEEDPIGWTSQKFAYDRRKAERDARKAQAQQRMLEGQQAFRQHTANIAVEKIPEWGSGDAYAKNEAARRKLALDAGFSQQEYENAVDLRYAVLLEWALKGKEAAKAEVNVEKKVARTPKVMKPGKGTDKASKDAAEKAARNRKLSRPHSIAEHIQAIRGG